MAKKNTEKQWQVEWLDVNAVTPYADNPRKNEDAVPYVKNSILRFGFRVPLVIDKDGVVVCGHTRLKAALELGMEKIPCVRATDLTPSQIKAFRLADNKVAEMAGWDFFKMEAEMDDLKDEFDFEEFGFHANGEPTDDFFENAPADGDKSEDKKKISVTCPHCGEVFEVDV